jgi:hypothetical protein
VLCEEGERHALDQRGEDAAEGLQRDGGSLGAAAVRDDVAALLVLRTGEGCKQRGLPDPRLAAEQRRPQRARPGRDQVGLQPGHLALSPDQSRRLGQLAGKGHLDDRAIFRGRERLRCGVGGTVMTDPARRHAALDRAHDGRRFGADLLGQVAAVRLVGAQGLGLAALAGQGLDEQAARSVAQGIGGDVRFERGHRLAGARPGDQQLGAILDREGPQLVEARDLPGGPRLVAELVEGLAVPEGEGLLERGQAIRMVGALDQEVGEHGCVDGAGDAVAGGVGLDQAVADRRPQARDGRSQRPGGQLEGVAEVLGALRRPRRQRERGEEPALGGAGQVENFAAFRDESDRTEQADERGAHESFSVRAGARGAAVALGASRSLPRRAKRTTARTAQADAGDAPV